jgi:hypothetical protein
MVFPFGRTECRQPRKVENRFTRMAYYPRAYRMAAIILAWLGLDVTFSLSVKAEDTATASNPQVLVSPYQNTFFDPDPNHPWNQLYGMLFIRPGLDGKLYGLNEMDPLYWSTTRYLLEPPIHQKAVAVLENFIQSNSAQLIKDTLRRALLQRMLWALFDHFALLHENPTPEKREIEVRLVKIMKSVALTDDEIKTLPDNYRLQIDAKSYASIFDSVHGDTPFLPDTFFSRADWIEVTNGPGPTAAPIHVEAVSCRSAFHVLMNLPGGRTETLAYLKKLHDFEPHWTYDWNKVASPARLKFEPTPPGSDPPPWPNPDLPQVPPLTKFALVRTANLINAKGDVVNSHLVETIQIRVIPSKVAGYDRKSLVFEMFTLDQSKLLKGEGGLIAMGKDAMSFDMVLNQFMMDSGDHLEKNPDVQIPDRNPGWNGKVAQFTTCFSCHSGGPGIFSMNSYTQLFGERTLKPPDLREGEGGADAAGRKGREYNWGLLQAYWFEQN